LIDESILDQKVSELLQGLYERRLSTLSELSLQTLLSKNPYLYRAIDAGSADRLIGELLAARISSSDETFFGNIFLEPLVLWSAQESNQHGDSHRVVTVGAGAGQDIAIETSDSYLAISVKSSKVIFNSQSTKGQSKEFDELQSRLKKTGKEFRPIVGFCYGRKRNSPRSRHESHAGQAFWSLITGEADFYLRVSNSIGKYSEHHGEVYRKAFDCKKRKLSRQFSLNFVDEEGQILWDAFVAFNSSAARPTKLKDIPEADDLIKS
jgi:hypothetical protein